MRHPPGLLLPEGRISAMGTSGGTMASLMASAAIFFEGRGGYRAKFYYIDPPSAVALDLHKLLPRFVFCFCSQKKMPGRVGNPAVLFNVPNEGIRA